MTETSTVQVGVKTDAFLYALQAVRRAFDRILLGPQSAPVTVPDIADFDARLAAARQRLRDHDRAAHWLVPGRTRLRRFLLRQLRERDQDVDRANAINDQFMLAYALGCGDAASEVLHALEAGEIRP